MGQYLKRSCLSPNGLPPPNPGRDLQKPAGGPPAGGEPLPAKLHRITDGGKVHLRLGLPLDEVKRAQDFGNQFSEAEVDQSRPPGFTSP